MLLFSTCFYVKTSLTSNLLANSALVCADIDRPSHVGVPFYHLIENACNCSADVAVKTVSSTYLV